MTRIHACVAVFVTIAIVGTLAADDDVNLSTASPVVIKAVPASGSDSVDPGVTEIKVTYSKDMTDHSWSWSTAGEHNFPDLKGKPHYEKDKRSCVLPVKLKPGKTYAMWLNSQNFGNFKDADGRSAVPYLLVFKTTGNAATTKPADASRETDNR